MGELTKIVVGFAGFCYLAAVSVAVVLAVLIAFQLRDREKISRDELAWFSASLFIAIAVAIIFPYFVLAFFLALAEGAIVLSFMFALVATPFLLVRLVRRQPVPRSVKILYALTAIIAAACMKIDPKLPLFSVCGVLMGCGLGGLHLGMEAEGRYGAVIVLSSVLAIVLCFFLGWLTGLDLDILAGAFEHAGEH